MQAAIPALADLRADIDRIDQAVLELLIERTEVVRQIAEIKADRAHDRLALRPAREAEVLRRLVDHAGERFPAPVLVRMWRELVAAQTRLQTPLAVAVHVERHDGLTWDLARDHFGSLTPMQRVESASQAIRAVGNDSAQVAVLPLPGDDDRWWMALMSDHYDRLRVFARLPFIHAPERDVDDGHAFGIGRIELEPSGDDLTLLAIEAEPGVSRGRLRTLLDGVRFEPVWLAASRQPGETYAQHLVETLGFVQDGDDRIGAVLQAGRGEVLRIVPLGSYARPITSAAAG